MPNPSRTDVAAAIATTALRARRSFRRWRESHAGFEFAGGPTWPERGPVPIAFIADPIARACCEQLLDHLRQLRRTIGPGATLNADEYALAAAARLLELLAHVWTFEWNDGYCQVAFPAGGGL